MIKKLTLLIAFLFLTGCSGHMPAIVDSGLVSNPTIGWKGYTYKIPAGYQPFDPDSMEETSINSAIDKLTNKFKTARIEEIDYSDIVVLKKDQEDKYIVSIVVVFPLFESISTMETTHKKVILNATVGSAYMGQIKAEKSKRMDINGHMAVYMEGFKFKDKKLNKTYVSNAFFILGDLDESYMLFSLSEKKHKAEMKFVLSELVHSLRF